MFEERTQLYNSKVEALDDNTSMAKFIEMIPRGSRVLEVGCSNGALSAYLTQQMGCTVVGIELNPEAARLAEQHCSRVVVGDVERGALERSGGPYDVITFGDVLEHLVCPGNVLAQCRQHLSANGFVLVSVPNVAHYSVRLRLLRGQFNYQKYGLLDRTHLRFFTLRTARQMLIEAGYSISRFDMVYRGRGVRFILQAGTLEAFLKRHLTELVGYQLIFKAVKSSQPMGEAVIANNGLEQWDKENHP